MSDRCLIPEELADLAPDDPRWAHLENCPACQAVAVSLAAFLDPADVPEEADLADADSRLSAVLDQEIGSGRKVVRPAPTFWTPFRVRAFAAMAAVLIVAVGLSLVPTSLEGPPQDPVLRGIGAPAAPFHCQMAMLEKGAFRINWPGIAEATGYRVVVYGEDLQELAGFDVGPATYYEMIPPVGAAFCRIIALRAGDELGRSDPAYFDDC
jgi:hypothetical protein